MHSRPWLVRLLSLAPIALGWLHKEVVHPRPFWSFYYDPELIYYFGGRHLAAGRLPDNLDNPGVPVHVLSAIVAAILGDSLELVPRLLFFAHLGTFILCAAALAWAATEVFDGCDWKLQVAGAWIFFCCAQSLEYLNVLSPESMFTAAGSLVAICIWRCAVLDGTRRSAMLAGLVLGGACSLKFTYLPLAGAFVFARMVTSPSIRSALREGALSACSVLAGLVLGTLPVIAGYERMFSFVSQVALRGGQYGAGAPAWPRWTEVFQRLSDAIVSAKAWYIWLAVVCLLIAWGGWRDHRDGVKPTRGLRFALVFALVGIVAAHAVLLRPSALRYLLPAALCAAVLLAVAARLPPLRDARAAPWVLLVVTAVMLGRHLWLDAAIHDARIASQSDLQSRLQDAVISATGKTHPVVVYGFRAPVASFALRIQCLEESCQKQVDALYPNEGHVAWSGQIRLPPGAAQWDALVVSADDAATIAQFSRLKRAAQMGGLVVLTQVH